MELVLISKSKGSLGQLRINGASLLVGLVVFIIGMCGVAYVGYLGGAQSRVHSLKIEPAFPTTFWQQELIAQRRLIGETRLDAESHLSTLAIRAGALQAHMTRLDAVAERLVQVANLDPAEFGLGGAPAIGGPVAGDFILPEWSSLLTNLESLGTGLAVREDRLDALEALIFDRRLQDEMHPGGRPVDDGWMSSSFGYRTHPLTGAEEFHSGVDFAGKPGLDVLSVGAGIVTWSGTRWGYGNLVEINHGNGYVTRYGHNKKNLVDVGDTVNKEQRIALLGSTGRSTGPHVHFEVLHDGKVVNPWSFIKQAAAR